MSKSIAYNHVQVKVGEAGPFKAFKFVYLPATLALASNDNKRVWYWRSPHGATYIRVQEFKEKRDGLGVTYRTESKDTLYSGRVRAGTRSYLEWGHGNSATLLEQIEALYKLDVLFKHEYDYAMARAKKMEEEDWLHNETQEFIRAAKKVGVVLNKTQLKTLNTSLSKTKKEK